MRRWALVVALLVASAACGSDGPKPVVLASFFPLAEAARAVAGSHAEVMDLTPPGEDPHAASSRLGATQSRPDVLVSLGGEFQPGLEALSATFGGVAVDGLRGLPVVDGDPHVWLDPTMLARITSSVSDALSEADPGHADDYAANARRYRATLAAVDRRLTAGLANCDRNVVVTAHAAWRYFTARYRLEQEPLGGVTTGEPAPGRADALAALVRDAGVTTVFREPLVPEGPITALAGATGARVATLDPVEGPILTGAAGTYAELMARNLTALRTALGCS
jgi:zinc transport system substrate-binding protein